MQDSATQRELEKWHFWGTKSWLQEAKCLWQVISAVEEIKEEKETKD